MLCAAHDSVNQEFLVIDRSDREAALLREVVVAASEAPCEGRLNKRLALTRSLLRYTCLKRIRSRTAPHCASCNALRYVRCFFILHACMRLLFCPPVT